VSVSKWEVFVMIVKSRKLIQLLDSSIGLNCKFLCMELVFCVKVS